MIIISVLVALSLLGLSEASWPDGRYCLPMPSNGQCPSGWQRGFRTHDTEDTEGSGYCSLKKYGWVPYNTALCRDLGWGFCCKTRANYPPTGKTWPKGHYCILRYGGPCPTGFDTGYIYWDDEDTDNSNRRSGVLPDGIYGSNTKINSCCRNDGGGWIVFIFGYFWFNHLNDLPKCSQMTLMRYKGDCPSSVNGYRGPHRGFLQWDTEDTGNTDNRIGKYPDGARNFITGIKIEFCSYTSDSKC